MNHVSTVSQVAVCFTDSYIRSIDEFIPLNSNVLILTSKSHIENGNIDDLVPGISTSKFMVCSDISPNPEIAEIQNLIDMPKATAFDFVIALGGGSVIDTAKILSYFIKLDSTTTLRESLQNELQLTHCPTPLIAIPTTSGTGAEMTPFATVWEKDESVKYSFTSEKIYPKLAIYDASLTVTMPFDLTLFTALDSISHALESLWNKNNSVISTVDSLSSLRLSFKYLPKLLNDLKNPFLRSKIQLASHLSGRAISCTRTALAHAVSYPLTYKYDVPHGLACSFMLSNIITDNLSEFGEMFDERKLFGDVAVMLESFKLKDRLSAYLTRDELESLLNSMTSNSRAGNYLFQINEGKLHSYVLQGIN